MTRVSFPDELKEQFYKLRNEEDKHTETLARLTAQLEGELKSRRTKFITRREISTYSNDVPVYSQLGNAFLLSDVPTLVSQIRKDLGKSDEKVLKIKQTGIYIVGQREDVRKQISDMIAPYMNNNQ
ncbi:Prefoldin subunit 1 [Tritrichomonas foetus]|uniref:Prefoldin subunit 1 n=1 Tax=Tritrichomonas foetus TaxID=1144522 RepID=A0A1J4KL08_9EUKA|nr:Prefoldin subunit 1 [Tritrichomonas foetus]|eukprot:OHT10476.1 Prefoldin subunit 1 [Tritrichomonas foetus]